MSQRGEVAVLSRRAVCASGIALPVVGAVAACSTDGGADERGAGAGAGGGTAGDGASLQPRTPPPVEVVGERAPLVAWDALRLPLEMTVMLVVDPGWTAPAQQLDGILVGYSEQDGGLQFQAVHEDGTILWRTTRPTSCTGFALSRTRDGRASAVLMDDRAEGGRSEAAGSDGAGSEGAGADAGGAHGGGADGGVTDGTAAAPAGPAPPNESDSPNESASSNGFVLSATAIELRTGEILWGPVPVPGPPVAPGLVFGPAGNTPGDQSVADPQAVVVLDPDSGEEAMLDAEGQRVLAENQGSVLFIAGDRLVFAEAHDGSEHWAVSLPNGIDAETAHVAGAIHPDDDFLVVAGSDGGAADAGGDVPAGTLLNRSSGAVIAEQADAAAQDLAAEVTVVVSGRDVRGLDDAGEEVWHHEDMEPVTLLCAGERLAYAIRPQEGTLLVLDTLGGRMVQPFDLDVDAPMGIPELFTARAATVVRSQGRRFLVTTTLDENFGQREGS